jgi:hypothetical protein
MSTDTPISFGDNVRVRPTPLTESLGLADMVGQVYGWTTPSETGVEVIGDLKDDYAVNVFFVDRNEDRWFVSELIEFVDHAPGTKFTIGKVPKTWTRTESGEWVESEAGSKPSKSASKPWWKVW